MQEKSNEIKLDDLVDVAIIEHGFTPYKRDYYFLVETYWQNNNDGQYIVLFKHCYDLSYQTIGKKETLILSWNDCFIDYNEWQKAGQPDGYVWGNNWSEAYPGFSIINNSKKAKEWSTMLGKEMNELLVETEIFRLNLIYHEWTIEKITNNSNLIRQVQQPLPQNEDFEKLKMNYKANENLIVEELKDKKGFIVKRKENT